MTGPANAWNLPTRDDERFDREVRASDFLAFATLPFGLVSAPGTGLPLNELAALGLVGLSLFRSPRAGWYRPPWFALALAAVLALMCLSAWLTDVDATRRLVHVTTWIGLALALSSGRISGRSAGLGLATGLVVACVLSVALFGASTYDGRLTGVIGDPNSAALVITTYGCIALALTGPRPARVALALVLLTALVLTFSRTGLLATAAVLLWVGVGRRIGTVLGAALLGLLLAAVSRIPTRLRQVGPFSDRSGSDELRERIIAAEHQLLDAAPWYGNGPGTSHVHFDGDELFFHNSYLATVNEGGYPLLVLLVGLAAGTFLLLAPHARRQREVAWTQAALIPVAVLALTLGEVWLELPAAVALGFAMRALARRTSPPAASAVSGPARSAPRPS